VAGKYNILVCTSIIESGLDIPRANTIIIHRADTFGMAQLYQLRGRVGRSGVQAYAYLVIPPPSMLSDDARERVETLARYTDLGAGFSVATMDMEIRGAGNLIGAEQSGNVAGVGIEMFCDLLEQAAAELRGTPIHVDIEPELTLDKPGYLPEEYIPDVGRRLEFYKRLASSVSEEEVESIAADLRDRFGMLPAETEDLVTGMAAKAICRRLAVRGLEVSIKGLVLHLTQDTKIEPDWVIAMVREEHGRVRLNPDLTVRARFRPDEEGGVKGAIHFLHRLEAYGNNLAIS
jgi:transcription-repair coupling factor (superfamily II helicase)